MDRRVFAVLAALTLVAGYVDAVAFFGLGVFTANMTGNTVLLAGGVLGRFFPGLHGSIGLLLPAISTACFVAGAAGAALLLRRETGRPAIRSRVILGAEALAIAVTAAMQHWGGPQWVPAAIALLSAVMGAQSVVATRAGVTGVSTTFVTGTLVRSILDLAGAAVETPPLRAEGRANAAVWACYLAGALAGGAALLELGSNALWVPAAVVAALLLVL